MKNPINGDAIKLGRESRSYNQTEFAKLLEVSQSTLSKIELKSVEFPDRLIPKLCELLNYPESFFRETPIDVYPPVSWISGSSYVK